MKKILRNKNNRIFMIAAAVFLAAAVIGGVTMALNLARASSLTNTFSVGSVDTEIEENVNSEGTKEPYVKNTGESNCLVRMRATVSPEDAKVELEGFNELWLYNEGDGFYYYQGFVELGKRTEVPLFTTYKLTGKADLSDFVPFQITLYQESIQTRAVDENGNSISAIDADGNYSAENAIRVWAVFDAQ